MTRFSFSVWQLWVSRCGTPSLTRRWICNLLRQLLLSLARAITLRSKSRRTHRPYFTVSYEILQTWRARSPYLYPPGTGCPSYTPGHWVPFLPPLITHRAMVEVFCPTSTRVSAHWLQVQVVLQSTVSQPVCLDVGPPSEAHDQIFITVKHLRSLCCGMSSLTIGRVCNLLVQFAVTLRSKSHRTHDHILLSHLRLLGSLFVASYDSQDYGGGILTRLHTGL
jgi:hypothetical protein